MKPLVFVLLALFQPQNQSTAPYRSLWRKLIPFQLDPVHNTWLRAIPEQILFWVIVWNFQLHKWFEKWINKFGENKNEKINSKKAKR